MGSGVLAAETGQRNCERFIPNGQLLKVSQALGLEQAVLIMPRNALADEAGRVVRH